jgi:hypothetical protein
VEFPVATYERHFFGNSLCDDDSVGGVFVVVEQRQLGECPQVFFGDIFYSE